MSTPEDTMRSDLEAAFDAAEKEGEEVQETRGPQEDTAEPTGTTETSEGETTPSEGDVESGTPTDTDTPPTYQAEAGAEEKGDETGDEEAAGDEEGSSPLLEAPRSWNVGMREKWGELPNDVREYIHQREREASVAIQRNAESAKYGAAMEQVLKPFESVMAMEAATPFQAVSALARTASTLRMGTPAEKAEVIKHLITSYSVDIETLDKALVDEPAETPEQKAIREMLDSRLKPVEDLLTRVRTGAENKEYEANARVDAEVSAFEANPPEFYADVKEDMADILDLHFRRTGSEMSLQDAYERAVKLNPEVSKVVTSREAAKRMAEKQAAAVSPAPTTPKSVGDGYGDDLRGAIERAWDEQEQGDRI